MPIQKLTQDILLAAIQGFEYQKQRIDAQMAELRQMLGGAPTGTAAPGTPTRRRRKMSAAARKRIGDAQRKRWAESRKISEPATAPKRKRKLSAAGRRAIAEATKKRWARFWAEGAKSAKTQRAPVTKKAAKKAPVKASRKASKKAAAKRPQKAAATAAQTAVPAATE